MRGIPHGLFVASEGARRSAKIEIWLEDLDGINYYVDGKGNVYRPEDVIQSRPNPRVVGCISGVQGQRTLELTG